MGLKERFEHYEVQPDPSVWKGINKRLRRNKALRYAAMTGAVAVIIVITVLAYRPQVQTDSQKPGLQQHPAMEENLLVAEQHAKANSAAATVQQGMTPNAVQAHRGATAEHTVAEKMPAPAPQQRNERATFNTESDAILATNALQAKTGEQNSLANAIPTVKTPQTTVKTNETTSPSHNPVAQHVESTKVNKVSPATEKDSLQIWIPNAFSPDDPLNPEVRIFKVIPKAGANISNFKMYIFNRAGSKVFQSTSNTEGWDGRYQGTECPRGAYVYIIEYTDQQGKIQHTRGSITLIR